MGILIYLLVIFIIIFFNYKRQWWKVKQELKNRYTYVWVECPSFWLYFILIPLFWIIVFPLIILWKVLDYLYNKFLT